jgi:hypothetical protein
MFDEDGRSEGGQIFISLPVRPGHGYHEAVDIGHGLLLSFDRKILRGAGMARIWSPANRRLASCAPDDYLMQLLSHKR